MAHSAVTVVWLGHDVVFCSKKSFCGGRWDKQRGLVALVLGMLGCGPGHPRGDPQGSSQGFEGKGLPEARSAPNPASALTHRFLLTLPLALKLQAESMGVRSPLPLSPLGAGLGRARRRGPGQGYGGAKGRRVVRLQNRVLPGVAGGADTVWNSLPVVWATRLCCLEMGCQPGPRGSGQFYFGGKWVIDMFTNGTRLLGVGCACRSPSSPRPAAPCSSQSQQSLVWLRAAPEGCEPRHLCGKQPLTPWHPHNEELALRGRWGVGLLGARGSSAPRAPEPQARPPAAPPGPPRRPTLSPVGQRAGGPFADTACQPSSRGLAQALGSAGRPSQLPFFHPTPHNSLWPSRDLLLPQETAPSPPCRPTGR